MTELDRKLADRIAPSGVTSPENWILAADILEIAANYAYSWTNRPDDAMRIPDVLAEVAQRLRQRAAAATEGSDGE